MTYQDVIYNINNKIRFTFTRYNASAWASMLGESGSDINGTTYTPELQVALQSSLKSPRGQSDYIGITDSTKRMYKEPFEKMTAHYGFQWEDADLFAKEWYEKGNIDGLLTSLEQHSVLLIAPNYYKHMSNELGFGFCRIDHSDWYNKNYEAIVFMLEKSMLFEEPTIYLWVAGLGAKPAITSLIPNSPNRTHIDIGSALDPYTGFSTRKYHSMKNPNLKPFAI